MTPPLLSVTGYGDVEEIRHRLAVRCVSIVGGLVASWTVCPRLRQHRHVLGEHHYRTPGSARAVS